MTRLEINKFQSNVYLREAKNVLDGSLKYRSKSAQNSHLNELATSRNIHTLYSFIFKIVLLVFENYRK